MSKIIESYDGFQNFLMTCGPFANCVKIRYVINFFKATTLPYCLILMVYYQNFTYPTIVYTALHSSYGLIWIIKDTLLGDKSWEQKIGLPAVFFVAIVLTLYWVPYYILVSGQSETPIEQIGFDRLFIAILQFNIGVFLMIATDVQKSTALKYYGELRKYDEKRWTKRIIDDGFMSNCRNFNFFGEIMLYYSYVIVVADTWCYKLMTISLFIALFNNIYKKERSNMSKSMWRDYSEKTLMMFPRFIKGSYYQNYLIWLCIFASLYMIYCLGGPINILKSF